MGYLCVSNLRQQVWVRLAPPNSKDSCGYPWKVPVLKPHKDIFIISSWRGDIWENPETSRQGTGLTLSFDVLSLCLARSGASHMLIQELLQAKVNYK